MNAWLGCVLGVGILAGSRGAGGEVDDVGAAQPASRRSPATLGAATRPVAVTNLSLPPLPDGVVDLQFREFFKSPVGPRGLELSDKLRNLDGKRVRLLGYMVLQTDPTPYSFLLAPQPVKLHEHEYGFADELPASTVHVFTDTNAPPTVPFTPGLLLLTGMLGVGSRPEPGGRTSLVRLRLDPPTEEQRAGLERAAELAAQERGTRPDEPHGHSH